MSKTLDQFDAETPLDVSEKKPEVEEAFSKLYGSDNAADPSPAAETFDAPVAPVVEEDTSFAPLYDPHAEEVTKPDPLAAFQAAEPQASDPVSAFGTAEPQGAAPVSAFGTAEAQGADPVSAFDTVETQARGAVPAVETPAAAPMPDVEAIERQAYEEGYRKGEETGYQTGETRGYEEGLQRARESVDRAEALLGRLETLWEDMVRAHEGQIIDLVGKVAERVVFAQVALDNEMVRRTIMEAFELIPEPSEATITVNPADYEFIEMVKEDFFKQIRGLKQVSVVSDPSVPPGDCKIETASGEVTTGVEKRLEAVTESLKASAGREA